MVFSPIFEFLASSCANTTLIWILNKLNFLTFSSSQKNHMQILLLKKLIIDATSCILKFFIAEYQILVPTPICQTKKVNEPLPKIK
jgi:hypothetical protein